MLVHPTLYVAVICETIRRDTRVIKTYVYTDRCRADNRVSSNLGVGLSGEVYEIDLCSRHEKPDGRWGCLKCDTSWDTNPDKCIGV